MDGSIMDYINGGLEMTLIGALYYAWRKYIKPYHERRNKLIEQLRKDKESAVEDKYKAMIKLAELNGNDKPIHRTRGRKKKTN